LFRGKKTSSTDTKNGSKIEPVIYSSSSLPNEFQEILDDLISMRGIIKLIILKLKGEKLYSYERWGKLEKSLKKEDVMELFESIRSQLTKIGKKNLNQTIIRSDDSNIIIFSEGEIVVFVQCDKKAKLPVITIKTKRITTTIAKQVK
jgi:predicted regulator of Ras-like GTPase activity (Roadblock/LC7/MglB family)